MKNGSQEGQAPKWFKPKETAKQAEEKDFAFVSKEVAYSAISASDWLACYVFNLIFKGRDCQNMIYWSHCLYAALDYVIDA